MCMVCGCMCVHGVWMYVLCLCMCVDEDMVCHGTVHGGMEGPMSGMDPDQGAWCVDVSSSNSTIVSYNLRKGDNVFTSFVLRGY